MNSKRPTIDRANFAFRIFWLAVGVSLLLMMGACASRESSMPWNRPTISDYNRDYPWMWPYAQEWPGHHYP